MITPTASFHAGTVSKSTSNTKQQFKVNQNKRNNGNSKTKSGVYCQQPHSSFECTNIVDPLGKDGLIRAEKLRTSYGLTNRPISKLYPIKVYDNSMSTQHMSSLERKSKIEARDKIQQWTIGM
jgi:hypothetical protein